MTFDLKGYRRALKRARLYRTGLSLALAMGLALIWWIGGAAPLSKEQGRLWLSVREAQNHAMEWRKARGSSLSSVDDPWGYGLIGLEWSPLSTTLGSLPSKRTACDPSWALASLRWFGELGLEPGDPVLVLSSSSFPGMMLNVLMAAESMGLNVSLMVSLGSSTWGCNDPLSPWPALSEELRSAGFLRTKAIAYTKGGGGETGGGIPPEGLAIMEAAALSEGVALLDLRSQNDVIRWKMDLIERLRPKAVVSIGGSSANMGDDPVALSLPPGPLRPGRTDGGDGVIGLALRAGYPVIHLLNLKDLSLQEGIPFDSPPSMGGRGRNVIYSLLGLAFCWVILSFFRRFDHMA